MRKMQGAAAGVATVFSREVVSAAVQCLPELDSHMCALGVSAGSVHYLVVKCLLRSSRIWM
jgi:hypothetical protein